MSKFDDYPIGHILEHEYNATIPKGWGICDGRETGLGFKTPNLILKRLTIADKKAIPPQLFIIRIS